MSTSSVTTGTNPPESSDTGDARQRILEATIAIIDEHGEAAVRMAVVAKDAGVTPGLITYYFGSREHLVVEAQLARFLADLPGDVDYFNEILNQQTDKESANRATRNMFADAISAERSKTRSQRASALGAAWGRTEMLQSLAAGQKEILDAGEKVFNRMRTAGLLDPSIDPRALAALVFSLAFGSVLIDITGEDSTRKSMLDMINTMIDTLIPPR